MRKNHDETSPNVRAGNVMGSQTTSQLNEPAVIPQRFNSTSQPCAGSIVNPELNSISEPKTK
jgi:hypothetical protein